MLHIPPSRVEWYTRTLASPVVALVVLAGVAGCDTASESSSSIALPSGYPPPSFDLPPLGEDVATKAETEHDWAIARGTVAWAQEHGIDSLPIGDVVAILGTTFVGTPYTPGTLEIPGPERLVVNLRTFDCVTLVEHLMVLARVTKNADPRLVEDDARFRGLYREELTRLRYRSGVLSGYSSRLHYFSEWIHDAESKGLVGSVARELGAVQDPRPISFMSRNPSSYRQIEENPEVLEEIQEMEERVSQAARFYIPQDQIAEREAGIQDGDVIAAVSTLDGLDIAHTGIAFWIGDRLHLLHAPLVGDSVQISTRPLAERIQGLSAQMGIMVARPLEPRSGV